MSTSTPATVYPLSNKQGVAIPLDVARPVAGYMSALAPEEELVVAINTGSIAIISIFSEQYAEFQVRVSGVVEGNFFLAPSVQYDLAVAASPDTVVALINKGTEAGQAILNAVVRWAQLDNQNFGVS